MTLTFEQFKQLRANGLNPQQIAKFEEGYIPSDYGDQALTNDIIQAPKGLGERLGGRFGERVGEIKETFKQASEMKLTPAEVGLQTVGKGVGFVGDVIGEGLVSILRGIGKITPDFIEDPAKRAWAASLQTPGGQAAINAISQGADKYGEWKDTHPRLAKNIESLINISDIFPIGKSRKIVVEGMESLIEKGGKVLSKGKSLVKETGEYATAQATSLDRQTIKTIIDKPESVTKAQVEALDRSTVADKVLDAIDNRIDEVSDTGKKYQKFRDNKQIVTVPQQELKDTLARKYGLEVTDKGIGRTKYTPGEMKQGDIDAIEDFFELYDTDILDSHSFLEARRYAGSNIAKYEAGKSGISTKIGNEIYQYYNKYGHDQITGLQKLDEQFAPEIRELNLIKSDYLKPQKKWIDPNVPELKDNATNKIANLAGVGKDKALNRIEKLVPDIREDLNILKAIEDIKYSKGRTVGGYTRAIGTVAAVASGKPKLIVAAILASPSMAVEILKGYGKIKKINPGIVGQIVYKMKNGIKLDKSQLKMIEDAILYKTTGAQVAGKVIEDIPGQGNPESSPEQVPIIENQ